MQDGHKQKIGNKDRQRPPSRPNSPRGQPRPKRSKSKGKGKGGGKNKGKGAPSAAAIIAPEPPWTPQAAPAPALETPAAPSAEATQLNQLVQALKKADPSTLTPDVQGLLATVDKKHAQTEVKSLYSAVGKLNQAQKQLQTAHQARTALRINWNAHLMSAVERWKGYATDFSKADTELTQQIAQAQESLQLARKTLADQRQAGTASADSEAQAISDAEENMEEDSRAETANAISDGINTMVTSLQELQSRAESLLPPAKRLRKEDNAEMDTVNTETDALAAKGNGKGGRLASAAMEPFGGGR